MVRRCPRSRRRRQYLVLTMLMLFAHRMNRIMVASIRMRFENRDLNEALTEQKVQERTRVLEAASRHKSEFLASMSHELRTPLNAIIGYSEMLQEDAADHGAAALVPDLRKIHSAGKQLLEMINSVLDLSKIEAGRMELHARRLRAARPGWPRLQAVIEPLAQQQSRTVSTVHGDRAARSPACRPGQAAPGAAEPAGQRLQVHRDGRSHLAIEREGTDGDATAIALQRHRHRHRHRAGAARPAVPGLRAGRQPAPRASMAAPAWGWR